MTARYTCETAAAAAVLMAVISDWKLGKNDMMGTEELNESTLFTTCSGEDRSPSFHVRF